MATRKTSPRKQAPRKTARRPAASRRTTPRAAPEIVDDEREHRPQILRRIREHAPVLGLRELHQLLADPRQRMQRPLDPPRALAQ